MMWLILVALLQPAEPLELGQPAPFPGVLITATMADRARAAKAEAARCAIERQADARICALRLDWNTQARRLEQADAERCTARLAGAPPSAPAWYERAALVWPVALLLGGLAGWGLTR